MRADGKPKKESAVNTLRSSLRCFFSYLAASGVLARDPSKLIRRARCGPPPPRTLSPEDQERLLAVLRIVNGGADYALFHLLLGAGPRISSALALEVRDLDLVRGEATLRHAKGDRPAVLVLPREVSDHLPQLPGWTHRGAALPADRSEEGELPPQVLAREGRDPGAGERPYSSALLRTADLPALGRSTAHPDGHGARGDREHLRLCASRPGTTAGGAGGVGGGSNCRRCGGAAAGVGRSAGEAGERPVWNSSPWFVTEEKVRP